MLDRQTTSSPSTFRPSGKVRRKEVASSIPKPKAKKGLALPEILALPAPDSSGRRNAQAADHEFNIVLEPIDFR